MADFHPLAKDVLLALGHQVPNAANGFQVTVLNNVRRQADDEDGLMEGALGHVLVKWREAGFPFFEGEDPIPSGYIHPTLRDLIALLRELDESGTMEDCYFEPQSLSGGEEEPLKQAVIAWREAGYPSPVAPRSEEAVEDRLELLLGDEDG